MADNKHEYRTVGEGITERRKAVYRPGAVSQDSKTMWENLNGHADQTNAFFSDPLAGHRELVGRMRADYKAGHEGLTTAEFIREHLGEDQERKGRFWYLREMIRYAGQMEGAISDGDAHAAAYWALEFSSVLTEYNLAGRWNRYAIAGRKQIGRLDDMRQKTNRERQLSREQQWAIWNAKAAEIWGRHPELSAEAVAIQVRRTLELSDAVSTIRQRIKKPDEAG